MEKIKEFYAKYQFLVWPVIAGLSFIIVLSLVIVPQIRGYLENQNKLDDLKKQINQLSEKAQTLDAIDQVQAKQDLSVVLTVLPNDPDPPYAMDLLQSLINKSGLVLKAASFSGGNKSDKNGSFEINLTVDGPLDLVRQFLINLQSFPLIYQVDSIGAHFQANSSSIEANLPIAIYYQPLTKPVPKLDQKVPQLNDQEQKLLSDLSQLVPEALASGIDLSGNQPTSTASGVPLGKADPFK